MDGFVSNECSRRRFLLAEDIAAAAATPIGPSDKFITQTIVQQPTAVWQPLATMINRDGVQLITNATNIHLAVPTDSCINQNSSKTLMLHPNIMT